MQKLNKYIVHIIILLIVLSGTEKTVFGQYIYYDSLTYAQYMNADWKGLIKSSKKALDNELDYYYLRMRRGIAFYERQNYVLAESNFKKALQQNFLDPVGREYIYYSRLFRGNDKYAKQYFLNNENYLKNKINISSSAVTSFSTNLLYIFRTQTPGPALFTNDEIASIEGSQLVTKNIRLFNFLLSHDLGKYFRLIHGGTILGKSTYLYIQDSGNAYGGDINNVRQFQYYAGLNIYPGANVTIIGAIHYLHYSFPSVTIGGRGMASGITTNSAVGDFYSGRFAAYKSFGFFKLGGGISISTLDFKNQFQYDAHLSIYPFGNTNLYFASSVFNTKEEGFDTDTTYLSIHNSLGFKAFGNMWVEGKIQSGKSRNLVTNDGLNVYNSDEIVTGRYEFSLFFPGIKHSFRIIAAYTDYYNTYVDGAGYTTDLNKINSKSLTLIGEIKWNF